MPIVFVHGVNTRNTEPGYDAGLLVMTKFVQAHFAGVKLGDAPLATLKPTFPYWGDLATTFAWDMASLPSGDIDALGPGVPDSLSRLAWVLIGDARWAAGDSVLAVEAYRKAAERGDENNPTVQRALEQLRRLTGNPDLP